MDIIGAIRRACKRRPRIATDRRIPPGHEGRDDILWQDPPDVDTEPWTVAQSDRLLDMLRDVDRARGDVHRGQGRLPRQWKGEL